MRKIAIINHKGGVGKTTTTINLAAALTKLGKKVLIADMDPQAHLCYSLGINADSLEKSMYEFLRGNASFNDILLKKGGLDIIPSSLSLSGGDIKLSSIPGREFLLKKAIRDIRGYDFIFFDCPPSLGLLTLNALTTADEILIPLQTEFLSLQGMSRLLKAVKVVQKRLNPTIKITGIVGTRFNANRNLNREVLEKVHEHFPNKVYNTVIRDNISIAEAPSFGEHIFEYKADSHGAVDYLNLAKEVLERGEHVKKEETGN